MVNNSVYIWKAQSFDPERTEQFCHASIPTGNGYYLRELRPDFIAKRLTLRVNSDLASAKDPSTLAAGREPDTVERHYSTNVRGVMTFCIDG